jgi:hypothetical protein
MRVIAIDPGTTQSAYVIWDGVQIIDKDLVENDTLLNILRGWPASDWPEAEQIPMVIEQIRCYGMAIGQTTLDTVFWSGRFWEAWRGEKYLIPRMEIKKHICHNGAAKDSNIIQALADRFAYGVRNRGKGIKKEPGFFFGFHDDIWQAFAVGITFWDLHIEGK